MKRHGNLFCKIIEPENLELAYRKARKGKSKYYSVKRFELNADANLAKIRQALLDKTFTTSKYAEKKIYEPKERTIYVLPFSPDRIVQHAIMNIIAPLWTDLFIKDTYACIEGRGVHAGSRRTMEFVRSSRYCLQCDISKFYPSIHHETMKLIIRRKIKCRDTLWLLDDIVDSFPGEINTPIGNLTSQWLGNLYMNELDQYVKHVLKIKKYIRYCDDFLAFHDDKQLLKDVGERMQEFVQVNLCLRLSKREVFPVSQGVDFLGYRHFKDYILLRKRTAKRVRRKLDRLAERFYAGNENFEHFESVLASSAGWMRWANTRHLRLALRIPKLIHDVKQLIAGNPQEVGYAWSI
jgi:retron-type reverse transcriptase